jgi:glycosyltransferase involved in cell wall biosynthesis
VKVVAVIPARNEVRTLRAVVTATAPHVDCVIVIDDGSDDGTADTVNDLDVELLEHAESKGKAAALARGFEHARSLGADLIVTLDADGQHDPQEIPRLVQAASLNPNHLVLGARLRKRESQPGLRRFANRFADFWVSWASGQPVPDSQTGFRVYPRDLVAAVTPSTRRRHGFVYETAMLIDGARAGFPCVAVAVKSIYRDDARASYFRPGRDIWEIFWFIFWRILLRGLYLQGLWRGITRRPRFHGEAQG